jgi:hypothetical protein
MPYNINLSFGTFAELVLACLFVFAAARREHFGRGLYVRASLIARRVAMRPWLMIVLAGVVPVAIRILILPIVPVPEPYVMEEFNHLFLTATYDEGRVANPVHPLAVLLQTYQQIEWPHYVSARPPLPPIFLYLGQVLFGSPFAGSLIALGLTSSALCWSLLGWIQGRWAALASYLAIVTFCLFGYWINSYWAPTPIVLGGALLFGAVPRIERNPRLSLGLVCVVALALLAGTRPYENGVYAATICGWLAFRLLQRERRKLIPRAIGLVVVPMAAGVGAIVAAQMWYNGATTGNALLMPYQIWRESQDLTPMFLWQPVEQNRVFYNSGALLFAEWNRTVVEDIKQGGLLGLWYLISRHAVTFRDLLGPFLFLAFACWSPRWLGTPATETRMREYLGLICLVLIFLAVCGPGAGSMIKLLAVFVLIKRWANNNERLAVLVLLIGMIATSLPTFYMNIYFAAYTAPLLLLVATGLRNLSLWNRRLGASLAGFVLLGAALVPAGHAVFSAINTAGLGVRFEGPPLSHFDQHFVTPRKGVLEKLEQLPGQHVVFVRLGKGASAPIDPVWNTPNVDAQKVVWLRDLRPEWTATAQEYYAGRRFWLVRVAPNGRHTLTPLVRDAGVTPAPLDSLPNPDRAAAEAIGARAAR